VNTQAGLGTHVSMTDVGVHFGDGARAVKALDGIDLQIEPGEFVSILGPSGCGKSTIVGALAGFRSIDAGQLHVDARPVAAPGPDRGVVFQQHTLLPWKTVLGNAEFGLKMRGMGRRERRRAATEMLQHVGLGGFLDHYPHQLSGGMQQRVALVRVLVNRPRMLLMDEPFGALDAQTRLHMQETLLALWHELRMTVLFVTHDVDEALFLSDRVIVLSARPGRIKAEIQVRLPRPRTPHTLTIPAFASLRREAFELLLGESPFRSRTAATAP
jgi:NitT/TauT family transport system ATP-binding protein